MWKLPTLVYVNVLFLYRSTVVLLLGKYGAFCGKHEGLYRVFIGSMVVVNVYTPCLNVYMHNRIFVQFMHRQSW